MNSFPSFLFNLLFFIALFTTIFVYLLYPVVLFVLKFFSHSKRKINNGSSLPEISIVVPTYNEACVINSKLVALLNTSFPQNRYEIIVVDSGSSDGTCDIVKKFENKGVILLQQEKRMGKCNAINFALKKSKGEIIVLSDANSTFGPGTLKKLVQKFNNGVGGVQPRICPYSNGSLWDKLFLWMHHIYKTLESNVDSVFFASGKLFAFRKMLITRLDENAAADDFEIALSIRRRNFKIKYAPDIKVIEKTPATQTEAETQRVRRAFGVLQAMRKNMTFLFNPKYRSYGLIIFPTHFLQMTLQPFLIFFLLIVMTMKIIQIVEYVNVIDPYSVGIFLCIVFLSLFLRKQFKKICSIGYNFLLTQLYIILAIFDLMRGKSYRVWKKVSSTRDILS